MASAHNKRYRIKLRNKTVYLSSTFALVLSKIKDLIVEQNNKKQNHSIFLHDKLYRQKIIFTVDGRIRTENLSSRDCYGFNRGYL